MASASLLERVVRTSALAAGARQRMQKRASLLGAAGKAIGGIANFGRGLVGAAPKLAPGAGKSVMHAMGANTPARVLAGAGGLYGAGYGAYHGLGIGKPPNHQAEFDKNRMMMGGDDGNSGLHGQYQSDIDATELGYYNPHTGARHDDWYSRIFGFQGLSASERKQQVASMQAKLDAAKAGTGTLGDYRGNTRGWLRNGETLYGTTYDQMREQAMQAAQAGVNQSGFRPGLMQRMMFDGVPRQVSDDAQKNMQSFIQKYGPKAPGRPVSAAHRFSYIGGRPAGPVDYSHLGLGTGFGHDYSGYYQPYGMVGR